MKFINLAIEYAKLSTHPHFSLGCILVYKNRVVATGSNSIKTDTKAPKYYKETTKKTFQNCHAEFNALKNFDKDWVSGRNKHPLLPRITAYIARIKADGTTGMARPCVNCLKMFKRYGIKTIYYTENQILKETLS